MSPWDLHVLVTPNQRDKCLPNPYAGVVESLAPSKLIRTWNIRRSLVSVPIGVFRTFKLTQHFSSSPVPSLLRIFIQASSTPPQTEPNTVATSALQLVSRDIPYLADIITRHNV